MRLSERNKSSFVGERPAPRNPRHTPLAPHSADAATTNKTLFERNGDRTDTASFVF